MNREIALLIAVRLLTVTITIALWPVLARPAHGCRDSQGSR